MTNPNFDIDLARGLVGENLVEQLPEMIAMGKVEIKTDYRAVETGNFYVETWQYSQPDATDRRKSGINITTADSWAFVIPQTLSMYLIATEHLKSLMRQNDYPETRQPIINDSTNASIGRLIPVADVAKMMLQTSSRESWIA